jgi:hypothetical protein
MSDNKVLNLFPIDYPFETLVQRADSNPPKLILNPEFQRKYKWDKDGNERASKFIESCLMRIPLPACYFAESDSGFHKVIDGVQRITTIKNFFNDKFRLEGLTIFKELEGKLFSEIGENYKNELLSTTIRCIILRKENPEELVIEIFARLNQGAVILSSQEIRHAIYPGSLDNLLIELGKDLFIENFKKGVSGTKEKNSREQEEMVLRYFAMQNDLSNYEGNLSKYLDKYTALNQKLAEDKISDLRTTFKNTLNKCLLVFGNKAFVNTTKSNDRQGLALYDLLMWDFTNRDEDFIKNYKIKITRKFDELCRDINFQKTLSGGLQSKSSILKRRNLWVEKMSLLNE